MRGGGGGSFLAVSLSPAPIPRTVSPYPACVTRMAVCPFHRNCRVTAQQSGGLQASPTPAPEIVGSVTTEFLGPRDRKG